MLIAKEDNKNYSHLLARVTKVLLGSKTIYGTIRDHIQEFYKGEMKKSLNLLINLADHIQE